MKTSEIESKLTFDRAVEDGYIVRLDGRLVGWTRRRTFRRRGWQIVHLGGWWHDDERVFKTRTDAGVALAKDHLEGQS